MEAILQILRADSSARIIACAPSNSAADLIALKLSNLEPMEMLRLNAPTREFKSLPRDLQRYSIYNEHEIFTPPTVDELREYRIIVATCLSAGVPHGMGIKPGHFTHIFVDEAGQCMEPEVMVSVMTMANKKTNIVLAGDHKQLGVPSSYSRRR